MKKIKFTLKHFALTTLILTGILACDKDYSSLESDVVNSDNTTNFETDVASYSVITYNKEVSAFQSNRLPANLIGYYNDPVSGTSTANFVAQMTPSTFDPTFGDNIEVDSIVLTVPYFSRTVDTDEDGNITYKLDSVYGNAPMKLSVFQNNYFLRDFNPDSEFGDSQKYYSNGATSESSFINPADLEGQLLYHDDAFVPSADQIILTAVDDEGEPIDPTKLAPSIRLKLDDPNDTYWKDLIFNKEGEPELSNQNNFKDYFRGLYIKAEEVNEDGSLMLLNFASANSNITIYYTTKVEGDDGSERKEETFTLNFSGNLVNLMDNNLNPIPEGDTENGDEKLYLKGGEGSMAVINLFNGDENGNSPEFTLFKNDFKEDGKVKRLINEAYLEFFVDQSLTHKEEPDRIYLYNIENNTPLIDYFIDQSVSGLTVNAKIIHLEPLVRVEDDPDGKGVKYKIRITEHLNNIVIRDSSNVKLGLVVTSNVGSVNSINLIDTDEIPLALPSGAILSPLGTVLHGNNTADQDKKVQLKIYYTEPDN